MSESPVSQAELDYWLQVFPCSHRLQYVGPSIIRNGVRYPTVSCRDCGERWVEGLEEAKE